MKLFTLLALAVCAQANAQSFNPAVTQATINTTICVSGWTATIRPPVAYTNKVKRRMMVEWKIDPSQIRAYELDHIMPLSLGGAPRDPKNLQIQTWKGATGALAKDKVEAHIHDSVCQRHVLLATAQACMKSDWRKCALI